MNYRSNLAYNTAASHAYPQQAPKRQSNVRIRVSSKKQQAAKTAKTRANVMNIVKILLLMACAFVVLYRAVIITDKCNAVEKKQDELNALVTANEKLQFEIDRSLDLKKVEAVAQNELGMRRAENRKVIALRPAGSEKDLLRSAGVRAGDRTARGGKLLLRGKAEPMERGRIPPTVGEEFRYLIHRLGTRPCGSGVVEINPIHRIPSLRCEK